MVTSERCLKIDDCRIHVTVHHDRITCVTICRYNKNNIRYDASDSYPKYV